MTAPASSLPHALRQLATKAQAKAVDIGDSELRDFADELDALLRQRAGTPTPRVWREYVGEELALFWTNPYDGKREKIASFWWPIHPAEKTAEVEATFETIADCAVSQSEGTYDEA